MSFQFVSEALVPAGDFEADPLERGEPGLPSAFVWRGAELRVAELRRTWRSTKTDRGDVYLKRHWFEVLLADGRIAVVYFERQARRGAPRWWLFTLTGTDPAQSPASSGAD